MKNFIVNDKKKNITYHNNIIYIDELEIIEASITVENKSVAIHNEVLM